MAQQITESERYSLLNRFIKSRNFANALDLCLDCMLQTRRIFLLGTGGNQRSLGQISNIC